MSRSKYRKPEGTISEKPFVLYNFSKMAHLFTDSSKQQLFSYKNKFDTKMTRFILKNDLVFVFYKSYFCFLMKLFINL